MKQLYESPEVQVIYIEVQGPVMEGTANTDDMGTGGGFTPGTF